MARKKKADKDLEKSCSPGQFAARLRKLADCIDQGKRFQIQVAGETISMPPDAHISIEHEREGGMEELEFQIRWKTP